MANRTLGKTELSVSPLCLDGNVIGWTADEQRSFAVLDAYMEGIAKGKNCRAVHAPKGFRNVT